MYAKTLYRSSAATCLLCQTNEYPSKSKRISIKQPEQYPTLPKSSTKMFVFHISLRFGQQHHHHATHIQWLIHQFRLQKYFHAEKFGDTENIPLPSRANKNSPTAFSCKAIILRFIRYLFAQTKNVSYHSEDVIIIKRRKKHTQSSSYARNVSLCCLHSSHAKHAELFDWCQTFKCLKARTNHNIMQNQVEDQMRRKIKNTTVQHTKICRTKIDAKQNQSMLNFIETCALFTYFHRRNERSLDAFWMLLLLMMMCC